MDKAKLTAELRRDEGEVLTAYKDSLGYWTIGVGHLIDPARGADPAPFGANLARPGASITVNQSSSLLITDIGQKEAQLDHALPWWRDLSDARQRVLLNMAFNLGVNGLLVFRKMLAAAQVGDYQIAANEMLSSKWAAQVKGRATRLAAMMVAG
jgi:lysozyme